MSFFSAHRPESLPRLQLIAVSLATSIASIADARRRTQYLDAVQDYQQAFADLGQAIGRPWNSRYLLDLWLVRSHISSSLAAQLDSRRLPV